jgi:alpha-tubulin suppressor-like RCC1 family protein
MMKNMMPVLILFLAGCETVSEETPVQLAPMLMPSVANAHHIDVGEAHACAALEEGGVKCWGYAGYGRLGNGKEKVNELIPVTVAPLHETATTLSAGFDHTCVGVGPGNLYCWGSNASGEIGTGEECPPGCEYLTAVAVGKITDAVQVNAGKYFTCAVSASGRLWCWGINSTGELGIGAKPRDHVLVPTEVTGISGGVRQVGAGILHACALSEAGGVWCWGHNYKGRLGTGQPGENDSAVPLPVKGLDGGVSAISVGSIHACALKDDRTVFCWGGNFGALGDGTDISRPVPVQVKGLTDAIEVSAGWFHTCALSESRGVLCWGKNLYGQLGTGDAKDSFVPVPVKGLQSGVRAVAAGTQQTCAILDTGQVKCWGKSGLDLCSIGSNTYVCDRQSAAQDWDVTHFAQ